MTTGAFPAVATGDDATGRLPAVHVVVEKIEITGSVVGGGGRRGGRDEKDV